MADQTQKPQGTFSKLMSSAIPHQEKKPENQQSSMLESQNASKLAIQNAGKQESQQAGNPVIQKAGKPKPLALNVARNRTFAS
jgi:hypothetical protein